VTVFPALVDTHAHLDMPRFDADRGEVITRARQAGVEIIVTIGIDIPSSRKAVELAQRGAGIFATVGIHPESAGTTTGQDIDTVGNLAVQPKVVAIGEIGLDFYHEYASAEKQIEVFRRQLELASRLKLPVVIHSRKAEKELIPVLEDWLGSYPAEKPGIIHCFNEALETARAYLKMGFYISLGGYIGYPSAKVVRDVVRELPLEKLVLETDSPFLPPQSHRGQRNEPAYVVETAKELAGIKGLSLEEASRVTSCNARTVFGGKF
jgi:TatD DNase family protein